MDPITHITAGALVGQSLRKTTQGRGVLWFAMAAAWAPDVDNAAGFLSPEFYLLYHRGITHSLVGGIGVALLLAAMYRLFDRKSSFWVNTAIAYGCVLFHIYLDVITSYGTMIFSPFTDERYSLHSVFIIDPFLTVIALIFLIASFMSKKRRATIAVVGVLWMVLYPMANYSMAKTLEQSIIAHSNGKQTPYTKIEVTADILTPLYWKVVTESNGEYTISYTTLWRSKKSSTVEQFPVADPEMMKKFGRKASMFSTYQWFSLYPFMKNDSIEGETRITIGDLRFYSVNPVASSLLKKRQMPFVLTAYLDGGGELIKYEYKRPGRVKFVQHVE